MENIDAIAEKLINDKLIEANIELSDNTVTMNREGFILVASMVAGYFLHNIDTNLDETTNAIAECILSAYLENVSDVIFDKDNLQWAKEIIKDNQKAGQA